MEIGIDMCVDLHNGVGIHAVEVIVMRCAEDPQDGIFDLFNFLHDVPLCSGVSECPFVPDSIVGDVMVFFFCEHSVCKV